MSFPLQGVSATPGAFTANGLGVSIVTLCFQVAGPASCESGLRQLVSKAQVTPSTIPGSRWVAANTGVTSSATYGAFLPVEQLWLDVGIFGISVLEARSMDPQQVFVLQGGYVALVGDA